MNATEWFLANGWRADSGPRGSVFRQSDEAELRLTVGEHLHTRASCGSTDVLHRWEGEALELWALCVEEQVPFERGPEGEPR